MSKAYVRSLLSAAKLTNTPKEVKSLSETIAKKITIRKKKNDPVNEIVQINEAIPAPATEVQNSTETLVSTADYLGLKFNDHLNEEE